MRRKLHSELLNAGIRAELDISANTINYKVREHSVHKVPLMFVVGAKEQESRSVSVRRLGSDKQEVLPFDEALKVLAEEAITPH